MDALVFDGISPVSVCVDFWQKSTIFKYGARSMGTFGPWIFKVVIGWVGDFRFKVIFHKYT